MDPLSFTANIIAVVGAAGSAAGALERLRQFRHAPEKLLLLINEVSDFETVLAICEDTSQQLQVQNRDLAYQRYLEELIGRAKTTLIAINEVLAIILGPNSTRSPILKDGEFSWKAWIKTQGQVDRLFITLRDLRRDIAHTCTFLTASQVPRLRHELRRISIDTELLSGRLDSVVAMSRTKKLDGDSLTQSTERLPSLLSTLNVNSGPQGSVFCAETTLQRACNPLCTCRCHQSINIKSPEWLKSFLGLLFIGYTGTPLLPRGACDQKSCKQESSSVIKLNYYFPSWLVHRMIVFRNRSTPRDGHMLSVRTPRVVDSSSDIFNASTKGNIGRICRLFEQGLASPFDVHESWGQTPLCFAVASKKADICKLLLDQFADPFHEGIDGKSPVTRVWALLLADPTGADSLALKTVFAPYLDTSDLNKNRFSTTHRIVLGLTRIGLQEQLELSTSDIDSKCSLGMTPLMWAIRRSDFVSVRLLLVFGAATDILDNRGCNIIHHACHPSTKDGVTSLRIILEELDTPETSVARHTLINQRSDLDGFCPLSIAAVADKVDVAQFLIQHGAYIRVENGEPINFAVQYNSHKTLRLLLSCNPGRLDNIDPDGQGILHLTGAIGDLETIQILNEAKLCGVPKELRDMHGNTPLESFLNTRQDYRTEDVFEREACLVAFKRLLESIVPDPDEKSWLGNQGDCLDLVELSSCSESDEEQFFDASSDVISLVQG